MTQEPKVLELKREDGTVARFVRTGEFSWMPYVGGQVIDWPAIFQEAAAKPDKKR
jgi:hypothetical protein